jgi:hypothetical protein
MKLGSRHAVDKEPTFMIGDEGAWTWLTRGRVRLAVGLG